MESRGEVPHLGTPEEFKKAKEDNKKMVIDFTATWCPPCGRMAPIFKELYNLYADIAFYKVDVDENNKTAEEEDITAMPTFKFYYNHNAMSNTLTGADGGMLRQRVEELHKKED